MGRSLSPVLCRELANLDKDADSRKSAMKALKSYVKDLDSNAIPLFLAQVSETKENGSLSGEYTISLYEVLARVHGPKIVSQIDSIMTTIIKTLASSAGSFPLQQACSKVVPAIARYGIDPSTPEDKKRYIIHSLCKPLSDSLLGSQECLTSGAALCLKALVDSDNWRFASDEMVNKVCQNVTGALEDKCTQTNSHMGLVMALAKHNALVVEAYARLLIQSGLRILNAGISEGNSQKRLSAIQMVNFLMKCLDPRSVVSEIPLIKEEMEECQADQMAFVKEAAFEALKTAKRIAADKRLKIEKSSDSGSDFCRRDDSLRRNAWDHRDGSMASASPESQTLDSFTEYGDSMADSPISMAQPSLDDMEYERRSVNRKLWSYENDVVDVSLKDGFCNGNSLFDDCGDEDHVEQFSGFLQSATGNGISRTITPSPSGLGSHINVDNINIFTTPRKLIRSLQDPTDLNSDFYHKESRRFRSPIASQFLQTGSPNYYKSGYSRNVHFESKENINSSPGDEQFHSGSESVSSTDDIPANAYMHMHTRKEVSPGYRAETPNMATRKRPHQKTAAQMISGLLFLLLAIYIWLSSDCGPDAGSNLVPT